jgi:hypothetical protein
MRFNGANSYINIRINRQGGSLVTITLEKKESESFIRASLKWALAAFYSGGKRWCRHRIIQQNGKAKRTMLIPLTQVDQDIA